MLLNFSSASSQDLECLCCLLNFGILGAQLQHKGPALARRFHVLTLCSVTRFHEQVNLLACPHTGDPSRGSWAVISAGSNLKDPPCLL